MICHDYEQFRDVFATSTTRDATGRKVWPASELVSSAGSATVYVTGGNGNLVHGAVGSVQESVGNGATFPWMFTVNGEAADSVFGTDEYDWFLSQRTDDVTKQYLSLTRDDAEYEDDTTPTTQSGRVQLSLTSLGSSTFGTTLTPAQLARLFDHVYVYAQRRSDDAIWCFDCRRILFTPNPA